MPRILVIQKIIIQCSLKPKGHVLSQGTTWWILPSPLLYLLLYSAMKVTNKFYFENNHFLITQSVTNSWGLHQVSALKRFRSPAMYHVPLFLKLSQPSQAVCCGEFIMKMGHKLIQLENRNLMNDNVTTYDPALRISNDCNSPDQDVFNTWGNPGQWSSIKLLISSQGIAADPKYTFTQNLWEKKPQILPDLIPHTDPYLFPIVTHILMLLFLCSSSSKVSLYQEYLSPNLTWYTLMYQV